MRTSAMKRRWLGMLCGALAATALAAPLSAADAPSFKLNVGGLENQDGSGSVKGVVKFSGEQLKPREVKEAQNDAYCSTMHKESPLMQERYVWGDNGTLQNVFVYVSKGLEGKQFAAPATKPHLDQHGCQYVPHVQGVVVGQELLIKNSDNTLHNVNAKPTSNTPFNKGTGPNAEMSQKFTKPEMAVNFKCDVHPWMNAYVHVMEHPFFAVTQQDGTFEIKGLPPGNYEVTVWHENAAFKPEKASIPVTVKAGEAAQADFAFAPPAKKGS
jgi:hypothetical protein